MLTLLIEAAVRSLILGLIVALPFALTRRRGGRVEMTAWILVLSASLIMPLLMAWTPGFTVSVPVPAEIAAPAEIAPAVDFPDDAGFMDAPARGNDAPFPWHLAALATYLIVATLMIVRLASGVLLSARLVRAATPLPDSALYGYDIRMSERIAAPLAFASTILVPADYAAWPAYQREAVLAHEAGHVTRGDFYVLLASSLNRALFWFSPLTWWLHDRLAVLAENASDAAAIETVKEPVVYAEVLFEFASLAGGAPMNAGGAALKNATPKGFAIAMARPNSVAGRIERILSGQPLARRISMRKHLLVFASLLPLVTLSAGLQFTTVRAALAATAPAAVEARTVEAFRAVSFSSSGKVYITVGKGQSLSVEASPELRARVTTEVRDGTLYIGRKNGDRTWGDDDGPLTVRITVPVLTGAKLSGSGAFTIDGFNGGDAAVGISGSGSLTAKGTLDKLNLDISGSGRADIPDLMVKDALVRISGSGNVKINAKDSLEAKVSGSGDIRYLGSPRITSRVSGSGSIDRIN